MKIQWDNKQNNFLRSVMDGMVDMVRVVDVNNTIILMNKKMRQVMGDMTGQKCYSVYGCGAPCEDCISHCAMSQNKTYNKMEILNGRIYSVLSSPVMDENGQISAAVEVFRDITEEQHLREQILQHNKKMVEDLDFARKIQRSFLPADMPNAYPFRFYAAYKPCEAVSGDIYDVLWIDEEHIAFYLADVAGHGVTAAMLTVFLKEAIHYRVKHKMDVTTPAQLLERLFNRFNQVDLEEHFYITLFFGILNIRTGILQYSNAGHSVPPLLVDQGIVTPITFPGMPISRWFPHAHYDNRELTMSPGARILLYTDGLVEVNRELGEKAIENMIEFLQDHSNLTAESLLDFVYKSALEASGDKDLKDDITLLLIERME